VGDGAERDGRGLRVARETSGVTGPAPGMDRRPWAGLTWYEGLRPAGKPSLQILSETEARQKKTRHGRGVMNRYSE